MVQIFQERRQHSVMTSEALACGYSEMRTPFVLYPETSICSPISCCAALQFLTFSEPLFHTLVMKVSRERVICDGTCAMHFYDKEASMFFYLALLKFSY